MQTDRRGWMLDVLKTTSVFGMVSIAMGQVQPHAGTTNAAAPWIPQFFSTEQNETFLALGERIVPGSAEALCNRLIDSVLPIESETHRQEFVASLEAFDRDAQRQHQQTFRKLEAQLQDEILRDASQDGGKLHREFGILKEWTADAYWSSLKGLRELGWTGRVAWDEFPGCTSVHPHN